MVTLLPVEPLSEAHGIQIVEAFSRFFINRGGKEDGWGDGSGFGYDYGNGDGFGYDYGNGDGGGCGCGYGDIIGDGNIIGNGWGGGDGLPEEWRVGP